jgi:transcriptional regulator with XRE-family HTH domain
MTQQTRESLARRLRTLRAEHQLTLRQAAKKFGVTRDTISALEHGDRGAHVGTLEKLAEGYGVSVEYLLGGGALSAREWAKEAGAEFHGMDDEAWDAYVRDLDTREEVSETYHKMIEDAKMLHALFSSHRMQYPRARGQRRELSRGLRELKMRRYSDLAGQAALLHARDLVNEIFAEVERDAAGS